MVGIAAKITNTCPISGSRSKKGSRAITNRGHTKKRESMATAIYLPKRISCQLVLLMAMPMNSMARGEVMLPI